MAQVSTYWFNLGPFTHLLFGICAIYFDLVTLGILASVSMFGEFLFTLIVELSMKQARHLGEVKVMKNYPHVCC